MSIVNDIVHIFCYRKPVAEIEYCITRLDEGVIHDLFLPSEVQMKAAFMSIGRTLLTGKAAESVQEEVR